jgi:hypothetical protein
MTKAWAVTLSLSKGSMTKAWAVTLSLSKGSMTRASAVTLPAPPNAGSLHVEGCVYYFPYLTHFMR